VFPRSNSRIRVFAVVLAGLWVALGLAALPARAAEPAQITLKAESASDGSLGITAVVMDAKGAPAAEVPVVFKARTTFGWLPIREVPTDAAGHARLVLPVTLRPGEVSAEAGAEELIRATVRLDQRRAVEPRVRPGRDVLSALSPQPGFISPYLVPTQLMLLALVLGGIWTTYGYVAWLLSRIRSGR